MAKRFFYVCAGLLCLAGAYHLGANSAAAQAVTFRSLGGQYVELGGNVFFLSTNYPGWHQVPSLGVSMPPVSASSLASVDLNNGWAITQAGEGWTQGAPGQWTSQGIIPGLPTPAKAESFGSVKARYR